MRKTRLVGAAISVLSMLFAILAFSGVAHAATAGGEDGDGDGVSSFATVSTPSTQGSPAPSSPSSGGGGLSNIPGVPSSFAACVAFRESTNGTASSNVYGIIPASGYNGYALDLAGQKAAFASLYSQFGTAPWAPYDGC